MTAIVRSVSAGGSQGNLIDIECSLSNGLPNIVIVGYVSKAVDEAKERIRSAFNARDLKLPRKRIIINLAPADIPKEGTDFDLPIAVAILLANQQISVPSGKQIFLGELGLDGTVREIRGIIGKILTAKRKGYHQFFIPSANLKQAQLIPNIEILPVENLSQIYMHLSQANSLPRVKTGKGILPSRTLSKNIGDFKDIVGQQRAKRAMEIAAGGHHNILLTGPPGTGKSMLAKALASIMPGLTQSEMVEVTELHSLAANNFNSIANERPFRSPHHTASNVSIIGGGQRPKPGEISLSHKGVLFLDELPEFNRAVIEALRQPLEDRIINVARAKETLTFPANFILVSTANPCPCGNFGSNKECSCMPLQVIKYQKKLSGPILDRIDLYVEVDEVEHEKLLSATEKSEASQNIARRVEHARLIQQKRQHKLNSELTNAEIKNGANLSTKAQQLLNNAASKLQLSARSYMRTIRVSRTIADLSNSDSINENHVAEALQYRYQQISV